MDVGRRAALVALEQASGRATAWATAQYLSFAETGTTLDLEVTLAVTGKHMTQGRAVGRVHGREILTVNAALGHGEPSTSKEPGSRPPRSPRPLDCPQRVVPPMFADSVLSRVEVRAAKGRMMEALDGKPGVGSSAFWARLPGHLEPSAATLAIIGDYVSGGLSRASRQTHDGQEPRQHDPDGSKSSPPSGYSATSTCTPLPAASRRAWRSCGPRTACSSRPPASR